MTAAVMDSLLLWLFTSTIEIMLANELIINGTHYVYQQHYIKEDELWECKYADENGVLAEVESGNLITYDESLVKAKKELESMIEENMLKPVEDNKIVLWMKLSTDEQQKIMRLAKKKKMELMGYWDTDDSRYPKWRDWMNRQTGFVFPRSLFDSL